MSCHDMTCHVLSCHVTSRHVTTLDRESVAILKGTCVTTTSSCARVGSFAAVGGTTADSPLRGCLQMDVTHTALRPSFSCFVVK